MTLVRRHFLVLLPVCARLVVAEGSSVFRGKLIKGGGLHTADGRTLKLTGDGETTGVLNDARLDGADFEVVGTLQGDTVAINPIHLAALHAYKDGNRLRVTYWCDICSIRTYTPGLCWCCREETKLDLREPDTVDKK